MRVNDVVLVGSGFPATRALLEKTGYRVVALQIGKIDAGLSCMSLRWKA